MSHWRIDNRCFGHAPFQSFTPRFPLPIYTTCSCLMSRPAESLASHFLCCSMCLSECGELLLKDGGVHNSCLNVKAGPTHGGCVIYTCCITWCSVLTDSITVLHDAETQSITNLTLEFRRFCCLYMQSCTTFAPLMSTPAGISAAAPPLVWFTAQRRSSPLL